MESKSLTNLFYPHRKKNACNSLSFVPFRSIRTYDFKIVRKGGNLWMWKVDGEKFFEKWTDNGEGVKLDLWREGGYTRVYHETHFLLLCEIKACRDANVSRFSRVSGEQVWLMRLSRDETSLFSPSLFFDVFSFFVRSFKKKKECR